MGKSQTSKKNLCLALVYGYLMLLTFVSKTIRKQKKKSVCFHSACLHVAAAKFVRKPEFSFPHCLGLAPPPALLYSLMFFLLSSVSFFPTLPSFLVGKLDRGRLGPIPPPPLICHPFQQQVYSALESLVVYFFGGRENEIVGKGREGCVRTPRVGQHTRYFRTSYVFAINA